jgi:hypothetical protein
MLRIIVVVQESNQYKVSYDYSCNCEMYQLEVVLHASVKSIDLYSHDIYICIYISMPFQL